MWVDRLPGASGVFELFNVNEELQSMVYEQASLW